MAKTAEIKILVSPEKKKLWKAYVDTMPAGFTLTNLIEMATDDRVAARVEPRDHRAGSTFHWAIKPLGDRKVKYEAETFALARKEIERLNKRNEERAKELEGYL